MKTRFLITFLLALCSLAHAQTYYVPAGVTTIRAMVVGGTPLQGGTPQYWRDFCAAQRVGLAQSVSDLPAVAAASGHPEIANAPFVTIGTSAGASAAASAAIGNPARAVAVVGLHGVMLAAGNDGFNANRSGENGDFPTLDFSGGYGVPMIHNFDNNDGFINPVVLQGLVEWGRAHGAPWTFFIHNDGNHTDNDTALNTLILPWLTSVLDLRVPTSGAAADGTVTLMPIVEANGWLGDIKTKAIASYATYAGDKTKADWFPSQSVATIWSGYHYPPTYNIPAQPIVAPSGIVADLTILDPVNNDTASGTGWKICGNLKQADQMGSLVKYFLLAPPPASVAGQDFIRPITPGKNYVAYTADPIFTFRVTANASVYVAHSDGAASRPAWLSTWTNTGEFLSITAGNLDTGTHYTLFKKDFAANSIVTCGTNAPAPSGQMYLTIVKPLGAQALPSVSVSASMPNAVENGANGAFTVTRTGATTNALPVTFAVSGTASSARYAPLGTSIVIPAGQSSATVTVATINDSIQQNTETVVLTLATDAAYNLGTPTSATVNILDDDSPPLPVVTVADTITTASEPSTPGQFTVSRTGATTSALTVNFTVSGSATSGADYVSIGTSVVIPAGQSSVALAVTPIDDALVEGTETVTLSIAASATYALGTITVASVNIADNDTSSLPVVTIVASDADAGEPSNNGAWTVSRTGSTASALAVTFSTSGTAARAVDYSITGASGTTLNIPSGQASATMTLVVTNDALVEGTETAICTISTNANYTVGSPASATINITDDDGTALPTVTIAATNANAAEPSTTGTFTVTRTGATTAALAVNFATTGTATSGTDYTSIGTSVSIPIGQPSATITVTPIDDALAESTETVIVTLSANAAYTLGSPSTATVNIADNDSGGSGSTVTVAATTDGAEPNTNGRFTFTRTTPTTGALTVNFTVSGTATSGVDYTSIGTSVTIAANQTTAILNVPVLDDGLIESSETVIVTIAASAGYIVGSPASATVNIADNDSGGTGSTVTVLATTDAAEPSTNGRFTFTRTTPTTGALVVNFTTSGTATGGADYTALPASVTISAGQTTAIVNVAVIDDAPVESTETVVVTITPSAGYLVGAAASAAVNLADNDASVAWVQQPAITYATHGTVEVKLDIYLPKNPPPGPVPVFIWLPGGGWSSVSRGNITDLYRAFAADGFAVVSVEHLNSGDGKWPVQIQDIKAAVRWLRANAATYNFDVTRFAACGSSSGAHMAAMLGTTGGVRYVTVGGTTVDFVGDNATNAAQSDAVQAVIPVMPPTHLLWMDHFFTSSIPDHDTINSPESQLFGTEIQTIPERVATANPLMFINASTPPFFITQGTSDSFVPFNQSELLNAALVRAGRPSTFWATVGGGHDGSTRENVENVLLIQQFLKRTLLGNTGNALPVASFTASALNGAAPLAVSFNGGASSDSDGSVTKYAWTFGEDTGAGGATASYTYTKPGVYPVTLGVRDNLGASASLTQFITVLASTPASGLPPSAAVDAPAQGLVLTRPANTLAQATVTDSDGTVATVEFILDGQSAGFDRVTPFNYAWGNLAVGAHTVAVRGYDNSGNVTLTPTPVTFYVQDPFTLPAVTIVATDASAAEPSDPGTFTVTRTGPTTSALTVNLTFSGNAVNGVDVGAIPASISLPAGQSAAAITLTPVNDTLIEGAETFAVSLAASANYVVGNPASASVLINDNDNANPIETTGIVVSTRTDGTTTRDVKLNVYRPATGSGPWPVIVYFPGGGWTSQYESSVGPLFTNLTAHGYAVVSANYVTSNFAKWPAQIQDGKAAVRWVRANAAAYGFDATRIGVTGPSSGGHIASYVAVSGGLKTARIGSEVIDLVGNIGGNFEQSDGVQAAAPISGPGDLLAMEHYDPGHNGSSSPESLLIGAALQTVPEKTATANPAALARPGLPPFWLTHGTADSSVPFNQSELLHAALLRTGNAATLWPVQGAGHGNGVVDSQEVHAMLKAFFDRTLKGLATNALPVAAFTASTLTGPAPLTVTFDGSASSDADGVIANSSWATGDNGGAAGATMACTFTHAGIFPVTLCVRDDRGGSTSVTANVLVHPAGTASATPPTVAFTGPADGFRYARTGDLLLQTSAAASGGATVASVEYFLNGEPIAWDNKSPFNTTLGRLPPGRYTAAARVSDSTGAATGSAPISFRVFGENDLEPHPNFTAALFGLSYYRFTDGTLSYSFERSDDLAAWTPFTPAQSLLLDGPQVQQMQATDPLGTNGIPRRCLRVRTATTLGGF